VHSPPPDPALLTLGCPTAPAWQVDWPSLPERFPWLRPLVGCPQDARWHPEGDVWTHTTMVGQAMVDDPEWRALEPAARAELFAAALLHDLGKPGVTRHEPDASITSVGHSRLGAGMARRELWRLGVNPSARERICALVRHHAVPYWAMQRRHIARDIIAMSLCIQPRLLHLLARCDARGKGTDDTEAQLDRVGLFARLARELGCYDAPFPFTSDHARVLYFRDRGRDPHQILPVQHRCRATLVCGPSASARGAWIREHAGEQPTLDPQSEPRRAHRDAGRLLRDGRDLCWSAPALLRGDRKPLLDLCLEHGARLRIVQVEPDEAPPEEDLLSWEPADLTEAHELAV
jgi:hypothetical protein